MRSFKGAALSILVLLSSLALAQPALAQNQGKEHSSGVGVGVEAMAGFPTISNVTPDLEAKTSYGFGLWVGGNRNGIVGFTGEFIYVVKKETLLGAEAKHQALEIPAVFHINFGQRHNKNGVLGYLVVGPNFTINVKDKLTGGLSGGNFSSANYGLIYGAGVEFARIAIEGRMNQDFKAITDNNDAIFQDSKARTFELLGKIRFN